MAPERPSPRTRLIWAGRPSAPGDPLNVPIVGASAYSGGGERGYARAHGTPTWDALEDVVGEIEGGAAVAFASGMAAIAAVLDTVPVGSVVVAPVGCYHGTEDLLRSGSATGRFTVRRLEPTDTRAWVAAASDSALLWLESPTNPLLEIMDLPAILAAARRAPACRAVVDNTFATPLGQTPLALGADIVVHSATKYLGGHSDLLLGVAVAAGPLDAQAVRDARTRLGSTPGMLEAYLATRGLRTLALRVDAATANAAVLARRLADHPAVTAVRYPGLPGDPGHRLASSFMSGFGAMVSFDVAGGAPAADAVCGAARLIRQATSLGSVESTMERRGAVPGQDHLPPGLIRLSVGCEDVEDLWRDLAGALAVIDGRGRPAAGYGEPDRR